MRPIYALILTTNVLIGSTLASDYVFSTPSDDRWFYPFNFNPCCRATASCFGTNGLDGFNDRDGTAIIAWRTDALITPGLGADNYDVQSIHLTLTNIPGATWGVDLTPDEWYTFDINQDGFINGDGIPRGEEGDTDGESSDADPGRPIEVFGVGFGPDRQYETWTESDGYIGSDSVHNIPRDPFPFVYQDGTTDVLHCEDNIKGLDNENLPVPVYEFTPQPWGIGLPVNYTPGNQSTAFSINVDIDLSLSDGRVKRYFQEQLNGGRVFLYVTSLADTTMGGGQNEYPTIYMKDSTDQEARPAELTIVLGGGVPCSDVKKLNAKCRSGKLVSKVVLKDESHDGQTVTVDVNGQSYDLTVSGRSAALKLKQRIGMQTVCLTNPNCDLCKSVDCGG